MTRAEKAQKYFLEGYTCSQAVALAFVDLTTLTKEDMSKISLPLGGGLGRLRLTCGAITGASLIIGLLFSENEVSEKNKLRIYERVRLVASRFVEKEKTLNCQELLEFANLEAEVGGTPEKRTNEYYQKRPCARIVFLVADILEQYLKEENIL